MSRLRAGVRRRVRKLTGSTALEKRLATVEAKLRTQNERLDRQQKMLDHRKALLESTKPWRSQARFEIIATQIGTIEERLQDLADRVEPVAHESTDQETSQARSLLAEVQEEHRRIRVRFGVITRYEERIRRLESALAEEMDAAEALAHEAAVNGALANAPTHGAVDLPEDPPGSR